MSSSIGSRLECWARLGHWPLGLGWPGLYLWLRLSPLMPGPAHCQWLHWFGLAWFGGHWQSVHYWLVSRPGLVWRLVTAPEVAVYQEVITTLQYTLTGNTRTNGIISSVASWAFFVEVLKYYGQMDINWEGQKDIQIWRWKDNVRDPQSLTSRLKDCAKLKNRPIVLKYINAMPILSTLY